MANSIWARLSISAQPADEQSPEERVNNWEEVRRGLDLDRARIEAARCIHCPSQPCVEVCPTHNDIPAALLLLERGDFLGAAAKFRETSTLPEMCGRLCPHERLCEGECPVGFAIRPDGHKEPAVGIGQLEAFVTDAQRDKLGGFPLPATLPAESGQRVAVVGSGPSGLTVAEELVKLGHACVIFDQWPTPGGALAHGIPNFKLAKRILQQKLQHLTMLGVDFVANCKVGRDVTIDELFARGFAAIYLGTGPGIDRELRIPGAGELEGIVTSTDFLLRANAPATRQLTAPASADGALAGLHALMRRPLGPRVVIIGGNDAALDSVRAALRLGSSSVTLVFAGERADITARNDEEEAARAEGVVFRFGTEPVEFLGDLTGRLTGVRLRRVELGPADRRGRRRAFAVPDSEFTLPATVAVISVGYDADPLLREATAGLRSASGGGLAVDGETGHTHRAGVFAGGDVVYGSGLVVTAMAAGKRTALAIDAYLRALEPAPATTLPVLPAASPATNRARASRRWFARRG